MAQATHRRTSRWQKAKFAVQNLENDKTKQPFASQRFANCDTESREQVASPLAQAASELAAVKRHGEEPRCWCAKCGVSDAVRREPRCSALSTPICARRRITIAKWLRILPEDLARCTRIGVSIAMLCDAGAETALPTLWVAARAGCPKNGRAWL